MSNMQKATKAANATKATKSKKDPDAEQTDVDARENAWERDDLDLSNYKYQSNHPAYKYGLAEAITLTCLGFFFLWMEISIRAIKGSPACGRPFRSLPSCLRLPWPRLPCLWS